MERRMNGVQVQLGTPSVAAPDAERALRDLINAVEGDVRVGELDRKLYATDASIYQVEPLAVVVPASVEDAARALECCASHGLPVLPRGGGTSLAGQGVNRAVVIDLSANCDAIVSLDTAARRCRVEPGLTPDDLNRRIRRSGLFFAPDPSTVRQANIGGCIGNNAAGARSVKYGRTSDHVLGVDVCLPDGRRCRLDAGAAERDPVARELTSAVADVVRRHATLIRERFPRTLRRSAGYQLDVVLDQLESHAGDERLVNLAPLICGSEGTLAMVLGAELNLVPEPGARGLAVIAFDDLDRAIAAVPGLLRLGPSAVELLDDLIVDLAKHNPEQRRHVELLPAPAGGPLRAILYVEFEEPTEHAVDDKLERTRALFPRTDSALYRSPAEMQSAWALRRAGEPLLHGVEGARKPLGFVEDNAVPPERLGEFVRAFRDIVHQEGTIASFYAHASVGVLHVRPLLDLRDAGDEGRMHRIAERAEELARSLGGVMSGEHGDGRARGPLLERYFGPELMGAFREIKRIFDPRAG
ncbi:MAG: FAD-binding oxidoreductase [Phycisphaerales bacterium]